MRTACDSPIFVFSHALAQARRVARQRQCEHIPDNARPRSEWHCSLATARPAYRILRQ